MRTRVHTGSAITLVNAIKSDLGSAIGIKMDNWVEIQSNDVLLFELDPPQDASLVVQCWELMQQKFDLNPEILISTHTDVPPSKGLKTSSAISTACIQAINLHFQLGLTIDQVLQHSTKASIDAGVSITGAIDDAIASYMGGIVVTDTNEQKKIYHEKAYYDYMVYLIIPEKSNPKSNVKKILSNLTMMDSSQVLNLIKLNQLIDVIRLNTDFYGPHLLENFDELKDMEKLGAEIIGINGAGPSLFALVETSKSMDFYVDMTYSFSEYILKGTSFRNTGDGIV